MSVNKHLPHVYVLPEDDANRQLATGFLLATDSPRQIQVLRVAGGWNSVLVRFNEDEVSRMRRYTDGFMVLLIDLDGKEERLRDAKAQVPWDLAERVFILGTLSTPEALKKAGLGTYEIIGKAMAQDCRDETTATWGHLLLRHNSSELDRLRTHVRPILFDPPNPAAHASGHG